MPINNFYKVLVLKVDIFESQIIDEKHFGTKTEALKFKRRVDNSTDFIGVVVQM